MGNVDRCKGFSAHLMKLLIRQRRSLTTLTEQWIILRYVLGKDGCNKLGRSLQVSSELLHMLRGMPSTILSGFEFKEVR